MLMEARDCMNNQDVLKCLQDHLLIKFAKQIFFTNVSYVKSFIAIVSKKWLEHICTSGEIVPDIEVYNIDLSEVYQSTYNFPKNSSLSKVIVHVVNKDIKLARKKDGYSGLNGESLYGLLNEYHEKCQSILTNQNKEKNKETIDWYELLKELTKQKSSLQNSELLQFSPIICVYEKENHIYIIERYSKYHLLDALKYTPSLIQDNHTSIFFIIYQITRIFITFRKLGFSISSDVTLSDFSLHYNSLWISLSSFTAISYCKQETTLESRDKIIKIYDGEHTDLHNVTLRHKLSDYTQAWCNREISNFDYIFILNKLAGRHFGESLNHPVYPWVTNFSIRYGGLRDLTKTKFRLNKGDYQLDATYNSGAAMHSEDHRSVHSQHHISDVLSDITYYIYKARQTSKEVLCKHVRPRWVPNEYPGSIERIYEWTPDECIPEFFYNPNIIKSIHPDLKSISLPVFIDSPEAFVKYHYQMLECNEVSENLHHWIDLIFGYSLDGKEAKENKNVHLSLVDNHKHLRNYGVVKLFSNPHPKKRILEEKLTKSIETDHLRDIDMMSWEYVHLTSSLLKASKETSEISDSPSNDASKHNFDDMIKNEDINFDFTSEKIHLAEINFLDVLTETENLINHEISISAITSSGIGNFSFAENEQLIEVHKNVDDADFKLYFCLLVELVLYRDLLTRTHQLQLEERCKQNVQLLKSTSSIPRWLKTILISLIKNDEDNLCPFSSIHLMNMGLNFPTSFPLLFDFLGCIYEASNIEAVTINNVDRIEKISNQIEKGCAMLPELLDVLDNEGKDVLLTYLIPLFENKELQLYMFLFVFPCLTTSFQQRKSVELFLHILQGIYDHIKPNDDIVLLQQAFLSKAIASFGQTSFLKHLLCFVLDVLMKVIDRQSKQRVMHSCVCSRSASISHDLVIKSDSLASAYELAAYFGDTDSLCSLNLERMFQDNNSIQSDQMSQDNISVHSNKDDLNNIQKEFTNSFIEIHENEAEDNISSTDTVFSSQEIQDDNADYLIDINKTEIASLASYFDTSLEKQDLKSTNESCERTSINMDKEIEKAMSSMTPAVEETPLSIHDAVVETVKWLIPSLGPNLATKHVAEPLLSRLSRMFLSCDEEPGYEVDRFLDHIAPTICCLSEMSSSYGDNVVLYLYLPYVARIVENGHNASSISISLGSNVVAFVQLLYESSKILTAVTIQGYFEMFSEMFFQPLIRLLSTLKPFSVAITVRQFLSRKIIDILGLLCQNVNRELAQEMAGSLIQQFFSCFDGIYSLQRNEDGVNEVIRKSSFLTGSLSDTNNSKSSKGGRSKSIVKEKSIEFKSPSCSDLFDKPLERATENKLSIDDILENDQIRSLTPHDHELDIYETFSPSLAYHAYVLLSRVLGNHYLDNILYNNELVWQLCAMHDEGLASMEGNDPQARDSMQNAKTTMYPKRSSFNCNDTEESTRSTFQHLNGKWLEYWKSNIGSEKSFNFTDVRLQAYAGHFSAIRDFYVPDNEHYFLSASRDKTVKLWLLKNHGNGTANLPCMRTYDRHKRAVFAVQGVESNRWVVSCDGTACVWDPVGGQTICEFEAGGGNTITSLCTLPQPSTCIAVASTEGNMRLYDVRQKKYAQDWKLSPQASVGMVRAICVNPSGTWISAGFSSGIVSMLDLKVGLLRGQVKVHDGEIVQMLSLPNMGFVSSSMDSNLRMWNEDGTVTHIRKTANECLHSVVNVNQTMICGSSANKISFYNTFDLVSPSTYRINENTLKGNLTKMAVLPLNQLYLFGADNGNVVLSA